MMSDGLEDTPEMPSIDISVGVDEFLKPEIEPLPEVFPTIYPEIPDMGGFSKLEVMPEKDNSWLWFLGAAALLFLMSNKGKK